MNNYSEGKKKKRKKKIEISLSVQTPAKVNARGKQERQQRLEDNRKRPEKRGPMISLCSFIDHLKLDPNVPSEEKRLKQKVNKSQKKKY